MAKKPGTLSRRDFLRDAALAAGAVGVASMLPPGAAGLVATAHAQEAKIGAQLIGKLEGPELVLDATKWPKKFAEAPMLADLVKQGKLPPVDKRVPDEPMVVKPLQGIGRYGGTWRRGFTGPGDGENGNRIVSTDKILFWDYTGTKIMPCVAREWKQSDDGKSVTISLRKGMKWSDGAPFTADDFAFWHDEIYLNKDLQPTPHPDFMAGAKSGSLRKIDDTTVVFEFQDPNYLFVDILAGSTAIGGGQATQSSDKRNMGAYTPAHYVKQFLPKFSSKDEVDKKAKAAGFDGWVSYIKSRLDWRLNPDLPVLTPWKTVSPINTPTWVLERNPFYMGVDTQGNQLPYIDRISMTLAENLEVLNLRAVAGQYDLQERHTALAKLPVFLENRVKGGYEVRLDPALNGSDATLQTNQAYDGRSRDRQMAAHAGLPPRARVGHRSGSAQRDVLGRCRHRGLHRPRRDGALQSGAGVAQDVVHARRRAGQSAARQGRARQEGRRGVPPAQRRQGAPPARAADLGGGLRAAYPDRRDDQGAVEEDRHPGRREGDGARPLLHAHREQ